MGQTITVSVREGAAPSVRFFDLDRSLTGMAIERYGPGDPRLDGNRPPDVLARRVLSMGATSVTVYSSVVTVEAPAARWAEIEGPVTHAIEHLFHYYGDDAGWSPEALGRAATAPLPEVAGA